VRDVAGGRFVGGEDRPLPEPARPARFLQAPVLLVVVACGLMQATGRALAENANRRPERPNIVVILADDLGYGDLGCYGATRLKTPHVDRMAREGLRLTDFHANAATCSPTRAALLTGQYQQRSGIVEALGERSAGLRDETRTMAEYLKTVGYRTAVFGKWHLGSQPGSAALPNRQGFDEFRGARHGGIDYASHVDRYGRHDWWHNDEPVDEPGYATDLLTEHSVRFIEQHRDEPFFLYLSHLAIHFPWMSSDDAAYRRQGQNYDNPGKVGPHTPEEVPAVVNRMIERLDDSVGRVMDAVRALGPERETLVIFTSDNGGYVRYAGGFRDVSSNGVLRGQKAGMHEGGHRVPCGGPPGSVEGGHRERRAATAVQPRRRPERAARHGRRRPATVAGAARRAGRVGAVGSMRGLTRWLAGGVVQRPSTGSSGRRAGQGKEALRRPRPSTSRQ